MGLEIRTGKVTYVNISNGRLYVKEKDKQPQFFDSLTGTIVDVKFKEDEYQSKKFEIAQIKFNDGMENYLLQMRTDSGYFRGFCNSLRSGNFLDKITVSPSYKTENDKPKTTFFVSQNNKPLKHFYTKDNMADFPQVEQITFKGQTQWDGSKQISFWKNWLSGIKWNNELFVEQVPTEKVGNDTTNVNEFDDLPF